jgi:hypothetical protein
MSIAKDKTTSFLLVWAALAGACDRSPQQPSQAPAQGTPSAATLKAADPACALPLGHFAGHKVHLTGSMLDYPSNLVLIDRAGQLRWNSVPVGRKRLSDYIGTQARIVPPPILVIEPERDAPCAVVRETLATAIQIGRCTAQRCAFQWPGAMAPPPLP